MMVYFIELVDIVVIAIVMKLKLQSGFPRHLEHSMYDPCKGKSSVIP